MLPGRFKHGMIVRPTVGQAQSLQFIPAQSDTTTGMQYAVSPVRDLSEGRVCPGGTSPLVAPQRTKYLNCSSLLMRDDFTQRSMTSIP